MGKVRNTYTNKPKYKSAARPNNGSGGGGGGGKTYIKRSNNRPENDTQDREVISGGKLYQKAIQSRDKYRELAREALVSGDRVAAENFHQHADHYGRIINSAHEAEQEKAQAKKQQDQADQTPQDDHGADDNVGNICTQSEADDEVL